MSSSGFTYFGRPEGRPFERLERNSAGDTLKKYGGTPTSWPTHSTIQSYGMSHSEQQRNIRQENQNITDFMSRNF